MSLLEDFKAANPGLIGPALSHAYFASLPKTDPNDPDDNLEYVPEHGELLWKDVTGRPGAYGAPNASGVLTGELPGGQKRTVAELVWYFETRAFPERSLSHINGDRWDTRYSNLSLAVSGHPKDPKTAAKSALQSCHKQRANAKRLQENANLAYPGALEKVEKVYRPAVARAAAIQERELAGARAEHQKAEAKLAEAEAKLAEVEEGFLMRIAKADAKRLEGLTEIADRLTRRDESVEAWEQKHFEATIALAAASPPPALAAAQAGARAAEQDARRERKWPGRNQRWSKYAAKRHVK